MKNEKLGTPKFRPAEKPLPIEAADQQALYAALNRKVPAPGGELPKVTIPQDKYSIRGSGTV